MQVDSISRLMQLNALQSMTGSSESTSSDSTSSGFSALLQGMLGGSQTSSSLLGSSTTLSNGTNAINSVSDLSLDPQKLAQMLQLQSMQNMFTNSSADDTDGTSSDDSSDDGTSIMPNTSNDMSQMYNYLLEAMSQNTGAAESSLTPSNVPNQAIQANSAVSSGVNLE